VSSYTIPSVVSESPRGDRIMDVFSHLLTERIVYLGSAIDAGVANALIAQLLHLDAQEQHREINMYINCEGGDLSATLAVYDTMQFVRAPIATTCVGEAIGPGAALLAAGAPGRRSALQHARVVLHQPADQGRGTIPDLILRAEELVRVRSDLEHVLSQHTGQTVENLRRDTDRDRVFTATAAREYGLIDEILNVRRERASAA
jgi:ATP-dependent Clp protease, protease subunit